MPEIFFGRGSERFSYFAHAWEKLSTSEFIILYGLILSRDENLKIFLKVKILRN